jgi:hypothetical protein
MPVSGGSGGEEDGAAVVWRWEAVSGEDEGGRLREGRKFVLSGFIYFCPKKRGAADSDFVFLGEGQWAATSFRERKGLWFLEFFVV